MLQPLPMQQQQGGKISAASAAKHVTYSSNAPCNRRHMLLNYCWEYCLEVTPKLADVLLGPDALHIPCHWPVLAVVPKDNSL